MKTKNLTAAITELLAPRSVNIVLRWDGRDTYAVVSVLAPLGAGQRTILSGGDARTYPRVSGETRSDVERVVAWVRAEQSHWYDWAGRNEVAVLQQEGRLPAEEAGPRLSLKRVNDALDRINLKARRSGCDVVISSQDGEPVYYAKSLQEAAGFYHGVQFKSNRAT